jgi:hypothetical protein
MGDFPAAMQNLVGEYTKILLAEEVRDVAQLPGGVGTLDAVRVASAGPVQAAVGSLSSVPSGL